MAVGPKNVSSIEALSAYLERQIDDYLLFFRGTDEGVRVELPCFATSFGGSLIAAVEALRLKYIQVGWKNVVIHSHLDGSIADLWFCP